MKLLKCAIYLALLGTVGFFAGRLMSKCWLRPETRWFRSFSFERSGAFYEKFGIRKWQNKVLDMSRILPGLMPAKNLAGAYEERLPVMIQETCVAETVHIASSILGLRCLWIWPGVGGMTVTVIHIAFLNLPFILIQRYNRPTPLQIDGETILDVTQYTAHSSVHSRKKQKTLLQQNKQFTLS